VSRRGSEWRSGGIESFEVKGRLPLRCKGILVDFVYALGNADVDW